MYMQLVRPTEVGGKATEGVLFLNGTSECFTLEDKDRKLEDGGEKVYGETCVPRGEYEVVVTKSNRFGVDLPLLLDVPGFTGIRIHPGNFSKDTEGCILVGAVNNRDDDDFIGKSRLAFNRLFPKIVDAIERGERVTIDIV